MYCYVVLCSVMLCNVESSRSEENALPPAPKKSTRAEKPDPSFPAMRIATVIDKELFEASGCYVQKTPAQIKRWAEEVVEELAAFPNSDHDDLVDSTTQALLRFRRGGFISLPTDEPDEPREFKRKRAYY